MIKVLIRLQILIVFLISFTGFTQIEITPEQALEAVRNAQRVESLKSDLEQADVIIMSQGSLITNLKSEVSNKEMVIRLTNENYKILQTQYEALKANKDPRYSFGDFLKDAGKVFLGVVIGAVGILVI